jgi:hypothetical protein
MEIVNLTPHAINIRTKSGSIIIPVSDQVLRLETDRLDAGVIHVANLDIPLVLETYTGTEDLPNPKENTYFVVSRLVAERFQERSDLLYPTDLQRDDNGSIQFAQSLGVCHVETEEPQILVVLCGGNPMPLLLAVMTICPQDVVLLHSPQTKKTAEILSDVVKNRGLGINVSLLPINDSTDARSVLRALSTIDQPWRLDYTGGTKAMAAQARLAFEKSISAQPKWATYVDYANGEIRHDDGQKTKLRESGLSLSEIAYLHSVQLSQGPTFELAVENGLEISRHLLSIAAADLPIEEKLAAYKSGRAAVAPRMRNSKSGAPLKSGEWLEWLTLYLSESALSEVDGTEILGNQYLRFATGNTNAEVDVVVRVGSQVSLLTCGTTLREDGMLTDLKLKAMEAMQRGRQIGGDKTQVGLFCLASDKQVEKLEQQLFGQSTGPQHRVFGANTLLSYLSDSQKLEDLATWLRGV